MQLPENALFSFDEPDHLTRIHLRLELEDLGFVIREDGTDLHIVPEEDQAKA